MLKYQSHNPDCRYAGEMIQTLIESGMTKSGTTIRRLVESCGYTLEQHDFGDMIFRNAENNNRLRMVYVNRDSWRLRDESHRGFEFARWLVSDPRVKVITTYTISEGV
jgi:hypothetical protein